MKNSLFNTILTGVLVTSLILSVWYCYLFYTRSKEYIELQGAIARYQQSRQVLNLLVSDTVEYSRRDPAGFAPIFDTIGLKVNRQAPTGAASAPGATTMKPTPK